MAGRRRSLAGADIRVDLRAFGWSAATLSALVHPTIPGVVLGAEAMLQGQTLSAWRGTGGRPADSLLAQYAAHLGLLAFAGLGDAVFEPDEWAVVGTADPRLVRISARLGPRIPAPALSLTEAFAAHVGAEGLEAFGRSWAKPETVFVEIERRLRRGSKKDYGSALRAAAGAIRGPGITALDDLLRGEGTRIAWRETGAVPCVAAAASLRGVACFVAGGEGSSPLMRYSALEGLVETSSSGIQHAGDVVERILEKAAHRPLIIAIQSCDVLDADSRAVLESLYDTAGRISWLVPPGSTAFSAPLAEAFRPYVVSSRLAPAETLGAAIMGRPEHERVARLTALSESGGLHRFWDDGLVPELRVQSELSHLQEPRRSFLAAVALLGPSPSVRLVQTFLTELGSRLDLEALIGDGSLISIAGDHLAWTAGAVRTSVLESLSKVSRQTLAISAARTIHAAGEDRLLAARLFDSAGATAEAAEMLEQALSSGSLGSRALVECVTELSRGVVTHSPRLAREVCHALIANGRYAAALELRSALDPGDAALVVAMIERRRGRYASAMSSLYEASPSPNRALLEAEILRLDDDLASALERLEKARSQWPEIEKDPRWCYERCLVAVESSSHLADTWIEHLTDHQRFRVLGYLAHAEDRLTDATELAIRAIGCASDATEWIDASLDLVYTHFLEGCWVEARHEARLTLARTEETEGDRGAGGALLTLAYLCADDGQWDQAELMIDRLRRFHAAAGDTRGLHEVQVLEAHLALGRCRWDGAVEAAAQVMSSGLAGDLREAARLVLDEVAWIRGEDFDLAPQTESRCIELRERARLMRVRRGRLAVEDLEPRTFSRSLAEWERNDVAAPPPVTGTRSEKLRLIRSAIARTRQTICPDVERWLGPLASELGVQRADSSRAGQSQRGPSLFIEALARTPYPFDRNSFPGVRWAFAERNRLARWSITGSHEVPVDELDRILEVPEDGWRRVGPESLLWVEGLSDWTESESESVESLFRLHRDHHRLRRIVESVEATRPGMGLAPSSEGIIGESPVMREMMSLVCRIAPRDNPVLIIGESGTGKELVAQAVHRLSSRRNRKLSAVNCASIPESILERELFGHVRGAFTGAERDALGLIEAADGGTLFLDEIGELPLAAQAKLLRFLQEGEFRRVGDTQNRTANVRVVAATHRSLDQAVDEGGFREDLYFRIRVMEVAVPPLRARAGDIAILARHFLNQETERHRGGPAVFSEEVEDLFVSYEWPGNVRELQNTVRAAHALAGDSAAIELEHLPPRMVSAGTRSPRPGSYFERIDHFRRDLIQRALVETAGNQSRAARNLGITRQALSYQIRELGIRVTAKEGRAERAVNRR